MRAQFMIFLTDWRPPSRAPGERERQGSPGDFRPRDHSFSNSPRLKPGSVRGRSFFQGNCCQLRWPIQLKTTTFLRRLPGFSLRGIFKRSPEAIAAASYPQQLKGTKVAFATESPFQLGGVACVAACGEASSPREAMGVARDLFKKLHFTRKLFKT